MRVKYYMRGISFGIILTVIICSFSNKQTKQTMSDHEIMEAAKELGMVMKDENKLDLSVLKGTVTPMPENENESSISITPEPTRGLEETISPHPTEGEQIEGSQESTSDVATELREFQIKSGMGSEAVAKVVEEAGLVEEWEDFNRYLISNGYSSRIRTSNYSLPMGASYKEIAEKITKKP